MLSVRPYTPTEGYTYLFKPGEFGSSYLHFGILNLKPKSTFFDHSDDCEVLLILLAGKCTLLVGHSGNKANGILGSRKDVFTGDGCAAFIPHHTTFEIVTDSESVEIAFCKTTSYRTTASIIMDIGKFETPTDYQLQILENHYSEELMGEAVCFHRFIDETGSVTIQPLETTGNHEQIKLQNNDLILVPENKQTRLSNYEGICYQLIVRRFTLPQ